MKVLKGICCCNKTLRVFKISMLQLNMSNVVPIIAFMLMNAKVLRLVEVKYSLSAGESELIQELNKLKPTSAAVKIVLLLGSGQSREMHLVGENVGPSNARARCTESPKCYCMTGVTSYAVGCNSASDCPATASTPSSSSPSNGQVPLTWDIIVASITSVGSPSSFIGPIFSHIGPTSTTPTRPRSSSIGHASLLGRPGYSSELRSSPFGSRASQFKPRTALSRPRSSPVGPASLVGLTASSSELASSLCGPRTSLFRPATTPTSVGLSALHLLMLHSRLDISMSIPPTQLFSQTISSFGELSLETRLQQTSLRSRSFGASRRSFYP